MYRVESLPVSSVEPILLGYLVSRPLYESVGVEEEGERTLSIASQDALECVDLWRRYV